jgi:alkanesulfonate monooxygenase SsuD/methylene tetrahydromethanopterin reductase-like flavin-dependent oxidoreductase (luciferase family)
MVDVLSGGRTIVGFFRGVPGEQLVYGTNPAVTADMYREAFALVMHAWTEPETFGWEGRNYRFRTVSAFPRPLQQPHPPIVQSATTPEAAAWTGAHGYMLGVFAAALPGDRAKVAVEAFHAARAEHGSPSRPEDVVYRARVYVAESDEQAAADIEAYDIGNMRRTMAPSPKRAAAAGKVLSEVFAASGPTQAGPRPTHGEGPPPAMLRPDFAGSPATVARQLSESAQAIGWGFFDGLFTSPGLPHEMARRSLELFTGEVLPQLAR